MSATTGYPAAGADERTPSRAQYFSWINNTNEGPTEAQTLANLDFFQYLHDQYGMVLDIYAFDAGTIDGARFYGSTDSERFQRQFPRGFGPIRDRAAAVGTSLGLWGGPDGFGDTPEQARRRTTMMESLCRDDGFVLFKMDAVCGQLRPEHHDHFIEMMTRCRSHRPELILLNHRLDLGPGLAHATTFLWEGVETYIDVHIANTAPAPHNRACALQRGLPPQLARLTEDHGVCLSSCLDFWEDDLVLQAFNRCLILAPQVYGNPWLLRDDELPRLARFYNLHRRYRDILIHATVLPEEDFGPHAISRGDDRTRLITLRNLTWEPVRRTIVLDERIGLGEAGNGGEGREAGQRIELRRLHPHERILGRFNRGERIDIDIPPFRACLLLASADPVDEPGISGCDYELIRDVPGRPIEIDLLGEPGSEATVTLHTGDRPLATAMLDGEPLDELVHHGAAKVRFAGKKRTKPWHRSLGRLEPVQVPDDAEALYEATCFAADNNALEVRELQRSGPTAIPQVQAARQAFFNQAVFRRRHLWDRHLFDDEPDTGFAINRRWPRDLRIRGGAFRLDLGRPTFIDRLVLQVGGDYHLQPLKSQEAVIGEVSHDLQQWTAVTYFATDDLEAALPAEQPIRYIRLPRCPDLIRHVHGYRAGKPLDRTGWRAGNLFAPYRSAPAEQAWELAFTLDEAAPGSYLAIAIHGEHGHELAYAALRCKGRPIGAPRRAPSFPANTWEVPVRQMPGNYTYYFPITPDMIGRRIEAIVLLLRGGDAAIRPEVWLTAHPIPRTRRRLVLSTTAD